MICFAVIIAEYAKPHLGTIPNMGFILQISRNNRTFQGSVENCM